MKTFYLIPKENTHFTFLNFWFRTTHPCVRSNWHKGVSILYSIEIQTAWRLLDDPYEVVYLIFGFSVFSVVFKRERLQFFYYSSWFWSFAVYQKCVWSVLIYCYIYSNIFQYIIVCGGVLLCKKLYLGLCLFIQKHVLLSFNGDYSKVGTSRPECITGSKN